MSQLADFVRIDVLDYKGQFRFFRRLINYDDWRIAGEPQALAVSLRPGGRSDIDSERNHLRVGDDYVRILTMKECIGETRPLALDALLKIPANFIAISEWTPLPAAAARKEVNKRRRHFNVSKTGFISQLGNDPAKTNPRDVLVDESKQADIENLGDCLRALGEGQQLGEFSLTHRALWQRSAGSRFGCRRVCRAFSQMPMARCLPRPTTSSMPTSRLCPETTHSTCAGSTC